MKSTASQQIYEQIADIVADLHNKYLADIDDYGKISKMEADENNYDRIDYQLNSKFSDVLGYSDVSGHTFESLVEEIKGYEHGEEIIAKHLRYAEQERRYNVRQDFEKAFEDKKLTNGKPLPSVLDFSLYSQDIKQLAELYKEGKHQEDILFLLEDLNFHSEYSDFENGNLDKYINGENPKEEIEMQ